MNIQLINQFTNNFLSQAAEGLVENCFLILSQKNSTYCIVNEDNSTDNSGYQWKKCVSTQAGKVSKLQSDIGVGMYNTNYYNLGRK